MPFCVFCHEAAQYIFTFMCSIDQSIHQYTDATQKEAFSSQLKGDKPHMLEQRMYGPRQLCQRSQGGEPGAEKEEKLTRKWVVSLWIKTEYHKNCKYKGRSVIALLLRNLHFHLNQSTRIIKCGMSSEFVSLSIPSWQILTAHAHPYRGARDLAFCLKVPLDSLLVGASIRGSGETAQLRRLAWTFAVRIGDKYQIHLTQPKYRLLPTIMIENQQSFPVQLCNMGLATVVP